jgi:hypothetical protein
VITVTYPVAKDKHHLLPSIGRKRIGEPGTRSLPRNRKKTGRKKLYFVGDTFASREEAVAACLNYGQKTIDTLEK